MRPRKRFGQHFLTDQSILDRIIDSLHINDNGIIVEIGPGTGALTRRLINLPIRLTAVEIDRDLVRKLRSDFKKTKVKSS